MSATPSATPSPSATESATPSATPSATAEAPAEPALVYLDKLKGSRFKAIRSGNGVLVVDERGGEVINISTDDLIEIAGLIRNVIQSDILKTALNQLDDSLSSNLETGFGAWTGGTDVSTYTITADGRFQIDRPGYGWINGKKIVWGAGRRTGAIPVNSFRWVVVDATGGLQLSDTDPQDTIPLYVVLYDGASYLCCKENHPKAFQSSISEYLQRNVGTTIRDYPEIGALIAKVSGGDGTSATDRQIQVVGADVLDDQGLSTDIPDSGGSGVPWAIYYRAIDGHWTRYASQEALPPICNLSGTPTALDPGLPYTTWTLYVGKDDIESSLPQYIAVMGESPYADLATALDAISGGTATYATGDLAKLDPAQLGYAILKTTPQGGVVEQVRVVKSNFRQKLVGGQAGISHALLSDLGFAESGHVGFQPALVPDPGWVLTPGFVEDRAFDPEAADLPEVRRVLATLIQTLLQGRLPTA